MNTYQETKQFFSCPSFPYLENISDWMSLLLTFLKLTQQIKNLFHLETQNEGSKPKSEITTAYYAK